MQLQVTPQRSLVDEPLHIEVSGLRPGQRVRHEARLVDDDQRTWTAHAEFQADDNGVVGATVRALRLNRTVSRSLAAGQSKLCYAARALAWQR